MDKKKLLEEAKTAIIYAEKNSYKKMNSSMAEKRLTWLKKHINDFDEESDVKKAYLLLFKKLEIDLLEVPIIFKSNKKITWRSSNWCPVLEACKELNLDTRNVCKKGYEDSVNAFVQCINPKLKFSRDYSNMRPHGPYCEETIELID